jgi:hypothetical protein
MRYLALPLGFALLASVTVAGSISHAFAYSYTDEEKKAQQAACEADAMSLCKDDVPDRDKIIACFEKNKSKLSPPCLAIFNKGGRK